MIKLCVLVPTRNRPDLALAAVASVPQVEGVSIVVSDNSSEAAHRQSLAEGLSQLDRDDVTLIAPPVPLAMPEHWSWALDQVLATHAMHATVLTDRMLFHEDGFRHVLEVVQSAPDRIVSYNHDRCEDDRRPVRLVTNRWTGHTFEARSDLLLQFAAHCKSHAALPRMLNSIAPRSVLEGLRSRFGAVFAGVAPDFYFGFRTLSVTPAILYVDRPVLLHAHLDRSNGALQARGVAQRDHADFLNQLPGGQTTPWAPRPTLATVRNVVISEYCKAREEVGLDVFPPVDRQAYERQCVDEVALLIEPARTEMAVQLSSPADERHLSPPVTTAAPPSGAPLRGRVSQGAGLALTTVVPALVWRRFGIAPPTTRFLRFRTRGEAVAFWQTLGRRANANHLDVSQFVRVG